MAVHPHIRCRKSKERKEEKKSWQSTGGHLRLFIKPQAAGGGTRCELPSRSQQSFTHTLGDAWATLKSHGKLKLHFFPFILYSTKFFNFMLCKTVLPVDLDNKTLLHPHCSTPTTGTAFQSSKITYPVFLSTDSTCKACISTLSSLASDWQQRHSTVQDTNQQERSNHLFKGWVLWIFIFSVKAMSNYFWAQRS